MTHSEAKKNFQHSEQDSAFDEIPLHNVIYQPKIIFSKLGKHKSGNYLDGKQYLEFPKPFKNHTTKAS